MSNSCADPHFLAIFRLNKKASSPKYSVKLQWPRSEEDAMRKKRNNQLEFDFQPSNLKITNEYYSRYEIISKILDDNPEIVDKIHEDLKKILKGKGFGGPGRKCGIASDSILRIILKKASPSCLIYLSSVLRCKQRLYPTGMLCFFWSSMVIASLCDLAGCESTLVNCWQVHFTRLGTPVSIACFRSRGDSTQLPSTKVRHFAHTQIVRKV